VALAAARQEAALRVFSCKAIVKIPAKLLSERGIDGSGRRKGLSPEIVDKTVDKVTLTSSSAGIMQD